MAGYLTHRDPGDMENLIFILCLYDQTYCLAYRDLASQKRDLGKWDEQKSM